MKIIKRKPCAPCNAKYKKHRQELRDINIPLPQDDDEFAQLCREVGAIKPKVMVEIGSRDGGSLYMLAQYCAPNATIISIDIPNGVWGRKDSDLNKTSILEDLAAQGFTAISIEMDSQHQDTKDLLLEHLQGRNIDFLFIDGDHRYSGVLRDWELYHSLVKENGMVAFHDITERSQQARIKVFLLWRVLKTIYQDKEFITDELKSPGIGVVWK